MTVSTNPMSNAPVRTHAYIITGGDTSTRFQTATDLGGRLLGESGRQLSPANMTVVRPEKSISREQIASLLHDLSMTSFGGEDRVIIIETAELMTPEAGNALLKSLEEPPEQVIFMLLTPTVARLMPTLRSRAQILSVGSGGAVAVDSDTETYVQFFSQTICERFARIAHLADREEQLAFAHGVLRASHVTRRYAFATWMQEKLGQTQKSGNIRLLLEASALKVGEA